MLVFLKSLFGRKKGANVENSSENNPESRHDRKLKEKISSLEDTIRLKTKELSEEKDRVKKVEELNKKIKSEIEAAMNDISAKDKDINDKKEKLTFIAEVINSQPVINSSYEKYKKLLNEDYMKYANDNDSLAAEAAAFQKLQNVSKQLKLLTYDEALLNKNIIAIAGSFSSGKSSFMNSFFTTRKIKLPTGMDQTTAISSYVLNGSEGITGFSYKGGKVSISESIFKLFSYGKIEEFSFNMKQIIEHIVFRNTFVKDFKNLCFIDTPGFNPGQETETDYDTATSSIATANAIIWCVDIASGTIKSDEFDILCDIFSKNENIGIYVVLNKADLKSESENLLVMDEIENQLTMKGIPFDGISLYTSNCTFAEQPEEYASCFKGISLSDFLDNNDMENSQKEKKLLNIINEVYTDYIDADKARIDKLTKQLRTLKILENSFSQINDSKDEQISYYKARIDTKKYKMKSFEEISEKDDDLFDCLADLKTEMKSTIENDKSDIEKARELFLNMKSVIAEIFGHKYEETSDDSSVNAVKFCTNCGTELHIDAQFCTNCGKECI